jgi:hypothetical protein
VGAEPPAFGGQLGGERGIVSDRDWDGNRKKDNKQDHSEDLSVTGIQTGFDRG